MFVLDIVLCSLACDLQTLFFEFLCFYFMDIIWGVAGPGKIYRPARKEKLRPLKEKLFRKPKTLKYVLPYWIFFQSLGTNNCELLVL